MQFLREQFGDLSESGKKLIRYQESKGVFGPELNQFVFGVCDGGPDYWGVEFFLDMNVFGEPSFNGPGGSCSSEDQLRQLLERGFEIEMEEKFRKKIMGQGNAKKKLD